MNHGSKDIDTFFAIQLLRSFCPPRLLEEIEGDLLHRYERDLNPPDCSKRSDGYWRRRAKRRLLWNVIRFFRPGILLRNRMMIKIIQIDMVHHFFKIFTRNIWKRVTYSALSLSGLVLGTVAFALIGLYVANEKSYDSFHVKKDKIFRVRQDRYTNGELTRQWTAGPWGIGRDLKNNFPEVVRYACVNRGGSRSNVLSNGNVFFREERIFYASEDFFKLFSFELLKGVDSLVLKRSFTAVVSESLARRYFGDADPVGKTIKNNGKEEYEITGIFKDVPSNTHLKFDALFSFESLLKIVGSTDAEDLMSNWAWAGNYTYIELAPSASSAEFERKLPAYVEKKMGETLRSWGENMAFVLQPVPAIHLESDYKDEIESNGDGRSVQFLMWVAIAILVMAWVNYINLATAKSIERAREVGVRKVLGSYRVQLVCQFLFESLLMKLMAFVFSGVVLVLALPFFSTLVNREISLSILAEWQSWLMIAVIFFAGVLVSGVYPAVILSGFRPASVLKGKLATSSQGVLLRKGLVTFQFFTSVVILILTFVTLMQMKFMLNSPLGLNTDQILVVQGPHIKPPNYETKFDAFRESLLSKSSLVNVSVSSDVPGRSVLASNGGVRVEGQEVKKGNSYRAVMVDEYFKDTYKLTLTAGRWFNPRVKENWKAAVVNETAMRLLGFSDPHGILGKRIYLWDEVLEIVGVVKDYHQESLKKKVDQLIFVCDKETSDFYSIKINSKASLINAVHDVEKTFQASFPGNPFHYFFLDDYFNQQYQSDKQFENVAGLFTLLAIIIACLGLFGLSSYSVAQRTKEIGIRKILGASGWQIAVLVSKEFMLIVLISVTIAWPASYFLVRKWLTGFAYHIDIGFLLFVVPALIALLLSSLTVSGQSIKAANVNPVDHLKHE